MRTSIRKRHWMNRRNLWAKRIQLKVRRKLFGDIWLRKLIQAYIKATDIELSKDFADKILARIKQK